MYGAPLYVAVASGATPGGGGGTSVWVYVLGAVGGAAVTALVTWLIARRTTSGRIDTSTAETLWKEANDMRGELRNEVTDLRTQVATLSGSVNTLMTQNGRLADAHAECSKNEALLRRRVDDLEAAVERRRAAVKKSSPAKRATPRKRI